MIIKSMSRKVPSFGQLLGYIDREQGQEAYRIRHNLMGRSPEAIRDEFERNGKLLSRRKNGVYLYHEIISITRASGLSEREQKERLHDIAQSYIAARCRDNLVFGGLHQDKDHSFHYHLMISANRAGETGRLRLTKAKFREIQVGLENHVLQHFPELEQKVAIGKRSERKSSWRESEMQRRSGQRPQRDQVLDRILQALESARDRDSLMRAFEHSDLELYVRGKTLGVIDHESGKKHRLKTLDLEAADRVEAMMLETSPQRAGVESGGEKEKAASRQQDKTPPRREQAQRQEEPPQRESGASQRSSENTARKAHESSQEDEVKKSGPTWVERGATRMAGGSEKDAQALHEDNQRGPLGDDGESRKQDPQHSGREEDDQKPAVLSAAQKAWKASIREVRDTAKEFIRGEPRSTWRDTPGDDEQQR